MNEHLFAEKSKNLSCSRFTTHNFDIKQWGKGQNYEFHNVENQKEH